MFSNECTRDTNCAYGTAWQVVTVNVGLVGLFVLSLCEWSSSRAMCLIMFVFFLDLKRIFQLNPTHLLFINVFLTFKIVF